MLEKMYSVPVRRQTIKRGGIQAEDSLVEGELEDTPDIAMHAIVLAHIAARYIQLNL
jgi:hypothetical protein